MYVAHVNVIYDPLNSHSFVCPMKAAPVCQLAAAQKDHLFRTSVARVVGGLSVSHMRTQCSNGKQNGLQQKLQ